MDVEVWCLEGDQLSPVRNLHGWVSLRLGLRFVLDTGELTVFDRDGYLLRTPAEMVAECDRAEKLAAKVRDLGVDLEKV